MYIDILFNHIASVLSRYKKTSVEVYEARALGHMRSLRLSQISTHAGLEDEHQSSAVQGRDRYALLEDRNMV